MTDDQDEITGDEETAIRGTIAMIALDELPGLAPSVVEQLLRNRGLEYVAETDPENPSPDADAPILLNGVAGQVCVAPMPAPIPWSDLEGPAETAWWWPEATESLQDHKAHLIVFLMSDGGTPIDRHVQLSRAVAALCALPMATGVYWGGGTLVHDPTVFAEQVSELADGEVMPHLWIDMRLERHPDNALRFFTTGMTAFDQLEIEIERTEWEPNELLQFMYGVIDYLIRGPVEVQQGSTIGRTENEQFSMSPGPSMFDGRGDVIIIELDR